jgi:hypothetical protein
MLFISECCPIRLGGDSASRQSGRQRGKLKLIGTAPDTTPLISHRY